MADISKLKRRLPTPPPPTEGALGIERQPDPVPAPEAPAPAPAAPPILDGRSRRATGRTLQLNVKVSTPTKETILRIAKERGLLVAEVIEQAVEALEREGGR